MALKKVLQNQFGIILTSVFIIGKTWGFNFQGNPAPKATPPFDTLCKVLKNILFDKTDRADGDAS
jgi:hypothetical protein